MLEKSGSDFSSKIHTKVDSSGMPLDFVLTADQEQKINSAERPLDEESSDYLLADRGYDCDR